MSPVELIPPRLIAIASALSATAGIALMAVLGVFAIVAAYLVAKAHREGYARLSLPAAVTWYARLVLLGSIMLVAGGLASFLNLGLGAAFGPQYSYKAGVTTADYDLVAFQSLVLTGAGALAYLAHQALRRMVEPNAAAQPGKRFFLFANVAAFGRLLGRIDRGREAPLGPDRLRGLAGARTPPSYRRETAFRLPDDRPGRGHFPRGAHTRSLASCSLALFVRAGVASRARTFFKSSAAFWLSPACS